MNLIRFCFFSKSSQQTQFLKIKTDYFLFQDSSFTFTYNTSVSTQMWFLTQIRSKLIHMQYQYLQHMVFKSRLYMTLHYTCKCLYLHVVPTNIQSRLTLHTYIPITTPSCGLQSRTYLVSDPGDVFTKLNKLITAAEVRDKSKM